MRTIELFFKHFGWLLLPFAFLIGIMLLTVIIVYARVLIITHASDRELVRYYPGTVDFDWEIYAPSNIYYLKDLTITDESGLVDSTFETHDLMQRHLTKLLVSDIVRNCPLNQRKFRH